MRGREGRAGTGSRREELWERMAGGGVRPEPCGTVKWPDRIGEEDRENEAWLRGGCISSWQSPSDFPWSCRGLTRPRVCWRVGSAGKTAQADHHPLAGRGSVGELSPGCPPAPRGAEMLGFLSGNPSGHWCGRWCSGKVAHDGRCGESSIVDGKIRES